MEGSITLLCVQPAGVLLVEETDEEEETETDEEEETETDEEEEETDEEEHCCSLAN